MCVCVCVCKLSSCRPFKHVCHKIIKTSFVCHGLFKILSSFLIRFLVAGWNWKMNFPKLLHKPVIHDDGL